MLAPTRWSQLVDGTLSMLSCLLRWERKSRGTMLSRWARWAGWSLMLLLCCQRRWGSWSHWCCLNEDEVVAADDGWMGESEDADEVGSVDVLPLSDRWNSLLLLMSKSSIEMASCCWWSRWRACGWARCRSSWSALSWPRRPPPRSCHTGWEVLCSMSDRGCCHKASWRSWLRWVGGWGWTRWSWWGWAVAKLMSPMSLLMMEPSLAELLPELLPELLVDLMRTWCCPVVASCCWGRCWACCRCREGSRCCWPSAAWCRRGCLLWS